MTVRSAWHINPGQTRADSRLSPVGTWTPLDATQTRAGIIPGGTPMLLTGATMTGSISVGRAIVQGTATQGAYPVAITAAETITVANGHASLPRIDSVFLVAYDQLYDTSGQTLAAITYTQGTANASPTAPTAPPTGTAYLKLWDILVPAGASAGTPINWGTALTDQRVYTVGMGGINPGSTVAGAYVGQWRDNGGVLERWTGSAWESALRTQNSGQVLVGDVPLTRSAASTLQVGGNLVVTGVGQWQSAVKTANQQVTSSTTLVNDLHLVLPLAANAAYLLDTFVAYDGAFNAGNLSADWALPSGATMLWAINGPAAGGTAAYASNAVSAGTPQSVGTYGTGGSYTSLNSKGRITTGSTSGNLQLKWAQSSSSGTALTLYAGSWIRLQRIA